MRTSSQPLEENSGREFADKRFGAKGFVLEASPVWAFVIGVEHFVWR